MIKNKCFDFKIQIYFSFTGTFLKKCIHLKKTGSLNQSPKNLFLIFKNFYLFQYLLSNILTAYNYKIFDHFL